MGKPARYPCGIAEDDADSRKRRCVWHLRTFLEPTAQHSVSPRTSTPVMWGEEPRAGTFPHPLCYNGQAPTWPHSWELYATDFTRISPVCVSGVATVS